MAYSQHEWVNGEIITAEKLNNLEQGIADCGAREIEASAQAIVEKGEGEPSCDVEAKGSVSGIDFKFAFKGIKGERGEAAPAITGCEINIAGSVVSGKLSLSDGESVEIAGTYTADSGGSSEGDGGSESEGGDETPAGSETSAESESEPEGEPEGETVQEGGDSGDPESVNPDNGGGDED